MGGRPEEDQRQTEEERQIGLQQPETERTGDVWRKPMSNNGCERGLIMMGMMIFYRTTQTVTKSC